MSDRIGKFWFVTAVNWFGYHVSCVCIYTYSHIYIYFVWYTVYVKFKPQSNKTGTAKIPLYPVIRPSKNKSNKVKN